MPSQPSRRAKPRTNVAKSNKCRRIAEPAKQRRRVVGVFGCSDRVHLEKQASFGIRTANIRSVFDSSVATTCLLDRCCAHGGRCGSVLPPPEPILALSPDAARRRLRGFCRRCFPQNADCSTQCLHPQVMAGEAAISDSVS